MREFTICSGDATLHQINLITVLDNVPVLVNSELESIVNLNVSESVKVYNILIIRTK